jgi:hypothetical protein
VQDRSDSFSIRVTATNRHMCMSNGMKVRQKSGFSLSGFAAATDSGDLKYQLYSEQHGIIGTRCWRLGMTTLAAESESVTIEQVMVADDTLAVELSDGRTISVPLAWFPRLTHATAEERNQWRLIGKGQGIHWDALDEDISIEALLEGKSSFESPTSLQRWLESRAGAVHPH